MSIPTSAFRTLSSATSRSYPRLNLPHALATKLLRRSMTSAPTEPEKQHQQQQRPNKNDSENERQTHFGFKQVPISEKQKLVTDVFSSVASKYDIMNDLMSVGIHRLWKDEFVNGAMKPTSSMKILDCAGGTGDISYRILKYIEKNERKSMNKNNIVVCDINEDMLNEGRKKFHDQLSFVYGDAQNLPFLNNHFDIYCISFGMRNVPNTKLGLSEAYRILKPGGRFLMLEFAKVNNDNNAFLQPVSQLYDFWSFNVIPNIGKLIVNDANSYKYLVESIRKFPGQSEFLDLMNQTGFKNSTVTNYSFGIVACYSGYKPLPSD